MIVQTIVAVVAAAGLAPGHASRESVIFSTPSVSRYRSIDEIRST
jgi:hypothetical protein